MSNYYHRLPQALSLHHRQGVNADIMENLYSVGFFGGFISSRGVQLSAGNPGVNLFLRIFLPPRPRDAKFLRSIDPVQSTVNGRGHLFLSPGYLAWSNSYLSSTTHLTPLVTMVHPQVEAHAASLRDPDAFWLPLARRSINWIKPPTKALVLGKTSSTSTPKWEWFPDGTLNTCYNCVDRHPASRVAIRYDSAAAGTKETITYGQLRERVEAFSGVLKYELGVKKGDTVIIYSIIS
jgi:Acetyl-coenzyme A synthetase N-terminus